MSNIPISNEAPTRLGVPGTLESKSILKVGKFSDGSLGPNIGLGFAAKLPSNRKLKYGFPKQCQVTWRCEKAVHLLSDACPHDLDL